MHVAVRSNVSPQVMANRALLAPPPKSPTVARRQSSGSAHRALVSVQGAVPRAIVPAGPSISARVLTTLLNTYDRYQRWSLRSQGFRARDVSTARGPVHVLERKRQSSGPTWIFAHGFAGQAGNWAAVLRLIAPHLPRVVVLDLPGHGYSPDPLPSGGSIIAGFERTAAAAVGALLDEDNESCVVVGTSMGGLTVGKYVSRYDARQRVVGSILVAPLGAYMDPDQMSTLQQRFTPETANATNRGSVRPGVFYALLRMTVRAVFSQSCQRRLVADFRPQHFLQPAELARMPAKTLVICGGQDEVLPTSCRDYFFAHLPVSATRLFVPDYDHLPIISSPKRLAFDILGWARQQAPEFLARTPPAPQPANWVARVFHRPAKQPVQTAAFAASPGRCR